MAKLKFCVAVSLFSLLPISFAKAPQVPANKEKMCIASALYFEARGEPLKAKRAVLDVIANRVVHSGKTACQVIAEKHQFSWHRKHGFKPYSEGQRELLSEVVGAKRVLRNENVKHFFSGKKPYWAVNAKCKKISNLNFCELKEKA